MSRTTIQVWLQKSTDALRRAGVASAPLDAKLILGFFSQKSHSWLLAHNDDILSESVVRAADNALQRRVLRQPLAYIFGQKEFYGRDFIVSPDVLIPRPESEMIVDITKELSKENTIKSIIDVGTGSGCLGITLAKELSAEVVLTDISDAALAVATKNARKHNVDASFFQSDLMSYIPTRTFDLIVANLPYVDTSWQRSPETDYEPATALFAADNGSALIKKLVTQLNPYLHARSFVVLEADPCQHADIIDFAHSHGLHEHVTRNYIISLKRN